MKNDARHKADPATAALLYQRRLEERIHVFQEEKGMQGLVMDRVGWRDGRLSNGTLQSNKCKMRPKRIA